MVKRTALHIPSKKKSHRRHEVPDLQTQLEDLLHCVWQCEKDWRFFDRIEHA